MVAGGMSALKAVGRIEEVLGLRRGAIEENDLLSNRFRQENNQLVKLVLRKIGIKESQLKQLVTILAQCEQLQLLELSSCELTNIEPITALSGLTQLRQLNLFKNHITDVRPIYSLLYIEILVISLNPLEAKYLKEVVERLALKKLGLDRCGLTDCKSLIDGTQLQVLNLDNNGISDISPLQNLPQLKRLDLRDNDITAIPKWVLTKDWAVSLESDYFKFPFLVIVSHSQITPSPHHH